MRKICATVFSALFLSIIAQAQLPTGGNVFFGYSYSGGHAFTGNAVPPAFPTAGGTNMNGWEGSVEGKYLPWIGVVADLDWHYGGHDVTPVCSVIGCTSTTPFRLSASRHELLFGPRASVSIGKYTPFAEFLVGFAHQTDSGGGISSSDTSFATAIGGGLDYKLIKGLAWRVEGDSTHTSLFGTGRTDLRISTGIVFRF